MSRPKNSGPRSRRIQHPDLADTAVDLRTVAITTLVSVASDIGAPAAARAAAARSLAEIIGMLGRNQDLGRVEQRRNAAEMSPTEISDEIARLSQQVPAVRLKRLK